MRRYETRVTASETAEEFAQKMSLLPLIQRTMASAERAFHKALTTLRQLQKERTKQTEPIVCSPVSQPDGFVSQNPPLRDSSVSKHPVSQPAPGEKVGFVSQDNTRQPLVSNPQPADRYFEAA